MRDDFTFNNSYPNLVAASWINAETGEVQNLVEKLHTTTKTLSDCIFTNKKILIIDNLSVQFRFDFKQLNLEGDPTLDADFYDAEGKKISTKELKDAQDFKDAHHTESGVDVVSGEYLYAFKYKNFTLKIKLGRINNYNIRGVARIIKK